MNVMPNALFAARPVSTYSSSLPGARGPEILPSAIMAASGKGSKAAASHDTISHVGSAMPAPSAAPRPSGRTKADREKLARLEGRDRIAALAETNPSRSAVRSYFLTRIVDLRTA